MFSSSSNEMDTLAQRKTSKIVPKVNLDEPDENLLRWAQENLQEDPEKRALVIEELRDMIFERGECIPPRTDDDFLLKFLRARNFIVRLSHRLVVNYTKLHENTPEFFNVNYEKLLELSRENILSVPPHYDQDGRRLLIYRLGEWDPSKYSTDNIFQLILVIFHIALMEPQYQILGGQCILDFSGASLSQSWYFTPSVARQLLQVVFRAMPMRIKAIHIVNSNWIFDKIFVMVGQFLTDIMQEAIIFHQSFDTLHEHIDPKYLPKRYGGIHEDYTFSAWIESLKDNDYVLNQMEALGYTGAKEFIKNVKPQEEKSNKYLEDEL